MDPNMAPLGALGALAQGQQAAPALQPGQSALEWLQDTAKQRAQQAQGQRGALQPQIDEATAQLAQSTNQPTIDPAQLQEYARSRYLAGMGTGPANGGFGAELAAGNGAYEQAKMDAAVATAKRKDDLAKQHMDSLLSQDKTSSSDEAKAMDDMTRVATARALNPAMQANARWKNVGGVLYDTQTLDDSGHPSPVTPNSPVGKLYQQLHAEAARRATGPTAPVFQSDGERESWITQQTAAALARLQGAVTDSSFGSQNPTSTPPTTTQATTQATPLRTPGLVPTTAPPMVPGSAQNAPPVAAGSKFAGYLTPMNPGNAAKGAIHDPNSEKVFTQGQGASAALMAKYYVDDVVKQADASREMLTSANLLQSMKLPWGQAKSWTIEKLGPVADALRQAGITDAGPLLRQSIALNSAQPIIEKQRQAILQMARGVQTEGDATRALAQNANLAQPAEAAAANLRLQAAVAQRGIDRQHLFDDYAASNNGLYTGATQRWQAYVASTPLFAKAGGGKLVYEPEYVSAYMAKFPQSTQTEAIDAWRKEAKGAK